MGEPDSTILRRGIASPNKSDPRGRLPVDIERIRIILDFGEEPIDMKDLWHRDPVYAGAPGRVLAIIRFPRSEVLEDAERPREVERYLG